MENLEPFIKMKLYLWSLFNDLHPRYEPVGLVAACYRQSMEG